MPGRGEYVAANLAAASGELCLHQCCLPGRCLRWKNSPGNQLREVMGNALGGEAQE